MKKATYKLLRTLVLLLLVATTLQLDLVAPPVLAVTQADIDALREDAEELTAKRKELEKQLKALADDKSQALARKKLLDDQISNTNARIRNVESQIADYTALITQTQRELDQAEVDEATQMQIFRKCVRAMEEGGTISYWSVLFNASDFSDLLGRLDAANEVMAYRQGVVDELRRLQQEISDKKASLETQRSEQETARAELLTVKKELDGQRAEADRLVQEIMANESEYKETLDSIEAEEEAIQAKIVRLSKELAAANGNTSAALGGYIWPVTSRRITSPFGRRNTGIAGASTNHKGVDIGGVGYTSEVRAAKAGTVIVSQRSSSYGEYVVVSHGSGNTTLYAHMSRRKVSVGDQVNQGDALGITGSTGISNGPHLHFEITENSQRVDPLKYLTGYVKAW